MSARVFLSGNRISSSIRLFSSTRHLGQQALSSSTTPGSSGNEQPANSSETRQDGHAIDIKSGRPLIQYTGEKRAPAKFVVASVPSYKSYVKKGAEPEMEITRIVPKLKTFFSANPPHESNMSELNALTRKYISLPYNVDHSSSSKWIRMSEYVTLGGGTRLRPLQYKELVHTLNRLSQIDPQLMPEEVEAVLNKYRRATEAEEQHESKIKELDSRGVANTTGGRKSSTASIQMAKGEGEFLINGKKLYEYFPKVTDRQEILYPLKVVESEAKYNIFALVHGGGSTGQAGAIKNAIAKALIIHNPLLKQRLRAAGCMTRDSRTVERKKPGKRKARKMPTWVKR